MSAVKICNVWKILKGKNIFFFGRAITRLESRYLVNIDPLPTRYGGKTNVTILPGSGIGPEITECTLKVLEAAGAPLSYEVLPLSSKEDAMDELEDALISIRRNRVALKGNIEIQSKNPRVSSRNVLLRKTLDLYVYLLVCRTYPGLRNRFGEVDITVIRLNTEGEYLMLEHEPTPESVESLKIITRYNSERLAEFAFRYAVEKNRKKITVVHNAYVHLMTEGMFLEAAKKVSEKYPSIQVEILEVGVAIIKIASNPRLFDIILATNLNGSMLSNYVSGIVGGPGLSTGTNLSQDGIAVFEPGARNKGSSIVGKGIANPVAMIMSGINLLNHLGYHHTAETIKNSVFRTLKHDKIHTKDLGGKATSKEMTEGIIRHIRKQQKPKTRANKTTKRRWKTYCNVPERQPPK